MGSKRKSGSGVQQGGRPRKKARTRPMELEDWGEDVEDGQAGREAFVRQGIDKVMVGGKLRQTVIKLRGISECLSRSLLLELVEKACYIGVVGELLNADMEVFNKAEFEDSRSGGHFGADNVGVGGHDEDGHGKQDAGEGVNGTLSVLCGNGVNGLEVGEKDVGWCIVGQILERVVVTCERRHLAREKKAKWWTWFKQKEQDSDGACARAQAARDKIDRLETAYALKSVEKPSFKNIFDGKNNISRGKRVRGVKRNTSKTKSENNKAKIGTTSSKRKASENGFKFGAGAELNIEKETKRLKLVQPKIEQYFESKCKKICGWRGSLEWGETDQS